MDVQDIRNCVLGRDIESARYVSTSNYIEEYSCTLQIQKGCHIESEAVCFLVQMFNTHKYEFKLQEGRLCFF